MGSDLKDLCNLVGGMSPSDRYVKLLAPDNFNQKFAYSSIYSPTARAGPIIIAWYKDGLYVNGSVDANYTSGMRNVNFADTTTNPWGLHALVSMICTNHIQSHSGTITSRDSRARRDSQCRTLTGCSFTAPRPLPSTHCLTVM